MIAEEAGAEREREQREQRDGADTDVSSDREAPERHVRGPGEIGAPALGGCATASEAGGHEAGLEVRVEDGVAQVSAVGEEQAGGDEQGKEVPVVVAADAVVDPDAVVVMFLDAGGADGAMLAAWRFGEMACTAVLVGVEDCVVVRVGG